MTTMEEMERQMGEIQEEYDVLVRKLDETLSELKAISMAVEKLERNMRYVQDEVI